MSPAVKAARANCGSHTADRRACQAQRRSGGQGGRRRGGPAQQGRLGRGLWGTPRAAGAIAGLGAEMWHGPQRLEKIAGVRIAWGAGVSAGGLVPGNCGHQEIEDSGLVGSGF